MENPQGGLTVICYFANGSEAHGCCVEIPELVNYTIVLRESASTLSAVLRLSDILAETGEYDVFVYDFESNGTCAFGVPAVQKSIKFSEKCKQSVTLAHC